MPHFYRPKKSNTGFAASFSFSERDNTVFATILKQSGWDEKNDNGLFKESMNDPLKRVNIKLGQIEVAAIIDCVERARPFTVYHDADETPKNISFIPWLDKTTKVQKGFSFSISVSNKQDSSFKNSFYIGFSFAEARLIREFLVHSLHKSFNLSSFKPKLETINKPSFSEILAQEEKPEESRFSMTTKVDPLLDF